MFRRCYLPSQVGYKNYGGAGVRVCQEWFDFTVFLRDMGEQPDGMTIERKEATGDYCKANCEWLPRRLQNRNKRSTRWLTHNGEMLCLSEWAERLGIKPKTLRARLDDHGWSVERALSTPTMTYAESTRLAQDTKHGRIPPAHQGAKHTSFYTVKKGRKK